MKVFLLSFLMLLSCSQLKPNVPSNDNKVSSPQLNQQLNHQLMAISWFQNSGEAKALFLQGYALATRNLKYLEKHKKSHLPIAVVLDIDETVLDNSPYNAGLLIKNSQFPLGWKEWCEASRAKALPGVKDFLAYAQKKKMEIFYISNREENVLEATYQNLLAQGLPAKKENMFFKTKTSGKEERRKMVSKKFHVALLLGDNLNDFAEIFEKQNDRDRKISVEKLASEFGAQYIVFPNPMYGDWEGGIYEYQWKLPMDEKIKMHIQKLESF
ncbi:MAG: 5'-nucleotidase, lipoprotein e(P4) family [Bacteriovoracaceae bacterium]|nr:5'-nucleotidase, lipoprotein e(P4) family [Bacteriovoracaceae bacterium]